MLLGSYQEGCNLDSSPGVKVKRGFSCFKMYLNVTLHCEVQIKKSEVFFYFQKHAIPH